MKLSASSAGALTWLSVVLLIVGGSIAAPAGRLFCIALAALLAAIPSLFATGKHRLFAAAVLAIALFAGFNTQAGGDAAYDAYLRQQRR